ncbi:hypothetical protein DT256_12960 [Lactiplantibacillus plantarum]|nr:hypothetical protein DT256_12960 [Lactiplantibacillus plantarum]
MWVLFRPPGLGDNCWNVSRRRFELTHNPRHLKYESYSKPEATHFRLRIIWLLSIVTQAPPVGKPLKWLMNGHLTWYNLSLTILTLEL